MLSSPCPVPGARCPVPGARCQALARCKPLIYKKKKLDSAGYRFWVLPAAPERRGALTTLD
jgi:hypothetical protein